MKKYYFITYLNFYGYGFIKVSPTFLRLTEEYIISLLPSAPVLDLEMLSLESVSLWGLIQNSPILWNLSLESLDPWGLIQDSLSL